MGHQPKSSPRGRAVIGVADRYKHDLHLLHSIKTQTRFEGIVEHVDVIFTLIDFRPQSNNRSTRNVNTIEIQATIEGHTNDSILKQLMASENIRVRVFFDGIKEVEENNVDKKRLKDIINGIHEAMSLRLFIHDFRKEPTS